MLRRIAASVVIGSFIFTSVAIPVQNVHAAPAVQSAHFVPTKFKALYLTSHTYLKLKNVDIVEGDKGKAFVFTVTVYNGDNKSISLLDYWYKVKNKNGSTYKMKAMDANVKELVPAKANRDFTYYAEVDNATKLSDILVEVVKWDFSKPNYERKIGSVAIPANYANITPYGKTQQFSWNNQLLTTKLTKALLATESDAQHLTITWEVVNNGNMSIKMNGTKFQIRTKNGLVYPVEFDGSTETVAAKGKKQVTLAVSVPANVSLNGAALVWSNQPEGYVYGVPIVSHEIKTQTETVQVGQTLKLNFNSQVIETSPKEITAASVTNTLNRLDIAYQLTNKGKKSIPLPSLAFEYKSASGAVYPMDIKEATFKSINPGISKELDLSVEVPAAETQGKGTLFIYELIKVKEKDVKRLLGKHNVSVSTQVKSDTPFATKVDYKNTQGAYKVTVDKIYRNPWNNEDIIQAEIEVANASSSSQNIPVPELIAGVYLDGVKLKGNVQVIKTSNAVSIGKGQSTKYLVTTKVPYTQQFSTIKVEVGEKIGENTIAIGSFSGMNAVKQPAKYRFDQVISSQRVDKKSDLTAKKVKVYEGRSSSMFLVDLELTNKGNRVDQLSNWVGYFRNKSGMVFPAIISNTEDLINPYGKVSTSAYAIIPKNVGYTDFELIIGEGLVEGNFAKPTETPTSFIYPSIIELEYKESPASNVLENLELYPYTFGMKKVLASILDEGRIKFSFDYSLEQLATAEKQLTKRDVIVEIVDDGGKQYETLFKLGEDLKETRNTRKDIIIEDSNLFVNIPQFKNYTVNVYDVVSNHKRLIATKKMEWFTTSS
ncbi:hypothetical protein ACFQZE_21880 [Paenibacillus sp. GCM10027627]|uniref:hypothetical protein n=1 Tax=unclassified Paenibacillus TaxID=185978 RepID=UPI00363002BD